MRIGLMSDTHGFLDEAIFTYFANCDEVWHAGDFGPVEILDRLKQFKPVRGVYGNIDGAEIRKELPCDLEWQCDEVRVYMTHIGGYPGHYEGKVKGELQRRRPGLFIAGHSHILKVMRDQELGLVHMNPGACGHTGWHKMRTLLRFQIEGDRIHDVKAIELGTRGRLAKIDHA
jgi:putative phosphoesterase